jgi:hypothetical protein
MALQGWSCLFTWRCSNYAINESYIWNGPTDEPIATVYPAALNLMKLRSLMMGFGVVAVRLRISKIGAFRVYYNAPPDDINAIQVGKQQIQILNPPIGTNPPVAQTVDGAADQPKSCVTVDFYSVDFSGHSRKYLAGIPDVLVRTDPDGPYTVGDATWLAAFNAWSTALLNGNSKWTFKAKGGVAKILPDTYLTDATTGLFIVQCATIAPPLIAGNFLQLQGWKMTSKVYFSPNGTWQIKTVQNGTKPGFTQYILAGTGNVTSSLVLNTGTIAVPGAAQTSFGKVQLAKDTTRKRGNRSLVAPGRRLVRARVSA